MGNLRSSSASGVERFAHKAVPPVIGGGLGLMTAEAMGAGFAGQLLGVIGGAAVGSYFGKK